MKKLLLLTGIAGSLLAACSSSPTPVEIRLNQVGYYPSQEKIATVESGQIQSFSIRNANGKEVMQGTPMLTTASPLSGKERTVIDFSEIQEPGIYTLTVNGSQTSFTVKEQAWKPVADAALKAFYYQRTGMPIEATYAGEWNRPLGHPDTEVLIHPNAADGNRKAGTVISSPKGWYDAGDYNKYIVNSGFSIGLMQNVFQWIPNYFAGQQVGIPESSNRTPDLLDEMHYNLDWMLTMQDPTDGGVYHKLTTPAFEGFIRPAECQQPRYVVRKSVTATLDFAASMAQSARVFQTYGTDYPDFANRALAAAEKAYQWAKAHPEAYYEQNKLNEQFEPAVSTGEYGDQQSQDEFFWAATELYLATGKTAYRQDAMQHAPQKFHNPTWPDVTGLAIYAWLQPSLHLQGEDAAFAEQLKSYLLTHCDVLVNQAKNTGFHAPYGNKAEDFGWGCLSENCANEALSLVLAYRLTGNTEYLKNACRNADYLLGRNATGYCYVTGFGQKSPMFPHHRLSASDGIEAPIPGFLVGGPNPHQQDKAQVNYQSDVADESYSDTLPSYASNEIAINWNASLVGILSALDDALGKSLQ